MPKSRPESKRRPCMVCGKHIVHNKPSSSKYGWLTMRPREL